MHIQCTICSDLVSQVDTLYVTKCGHIFHHQCLAQWIERSKSCPQCRNKVTERCMFRLFPAAGAGPREPAAALQAQLDNAALQLRTQHARLARLEAELAAAGAAAADREAALTAAEKRLVSQECALAALRQQLAHARAAAQDAERLQRDAQRLQATLDTLHGLQRVLHAAAGDAEAALRDYSDPRTIATFAVALKRALCESESKKRAWRERQQRAARDLAALQDKHKELEAKLLKTENEYESLKHTKRKAEQEDSRAAKQPRAASPRPARPPARAPPPPDAAPPPPPPPPADTAAPPADAGLDDAVISEDNISFSSMVDRIVQSQSPYLSLRRSGLALCTLRRRAPPPSLKPSELAVLGSSATSIFRQKEPPAPAAPAAPAGDGEAAYDGLGGRARPDPFPARALRPPPRAAPRPGARHRLRAPPAGCRDIAAMLRGAPA